MALSTLTEDIQQVTRRFRLSSDLSLLEHAWEREIGAMSGRVRLHALDGSTLVVEALSSAALQETVLRRRELLRRLNAHFATPWLQQITVRMAHAR